jgi:hypothetical protein
MYRKACLLAALIALTGLASAQTRTWIPFDNARETQQEVRVLSSDHARTTVELEIPGIYSEPITAEGATYQLIAVPVAHSGVLAKIGSPLLPAISRLIAIPPTSGVRVNVITVEEQTLTGYSVYPAQPPEPENGTTPPFVKDEARYRTDAFYPEAWARVEDPAIWRDYRVVPLVIQPVRFNPVSGELKVARRIRLELVYQGASDINPLYRIRPYHSKVFEPLYREYIANFDLLPPTSPLTGSYLIVANDSFYNDVKPLADWKLRKGWRVKLVKTSEIGGQDSAHVYNCIHDAYLNWPYPVDYVLLVGDVEYVACCHGQQGVGTDHAYTKHAGADYLSEILLARISVKTHTECQAVVNKLVAYETDPYLANPDWFHKATTIGGWEGTNRFWTCCIQVRNELLAHSPITQVDTLFQRWGQATPTNVANAINEGRSWLLYRGHGAVTYWDNVEPDWTNACVQALTNGRMNPMVVGPTCLSGKYDDPSTDCHAEAWLKYGTPGEPKGACGYFGSSEVSYTGHNDSLALGTFVGYCESLNFSMTQSTYNGKLYMYRAYPPPNSTTELEFDMFNTFGEPDLQIYSNTPATLTVNHPATARVGSCVFPVQVSTTGPVENALVCVMCKQDTAVWYNGYTDGSGTVTFNLNCTQPGDSVRVTVTGRNLAPYLGGAIVVATNSPYVIRLRHAINDPAPGGNNDGIVNPGEAIQMPTWVKNWGSATASGVVVKLRSTDPMVAVTDSARTMGTINSGDSAYTGLPGFGFSVSPACTNGYALRFSLVCSDSHDSTWISQFSIVCGTGVLQYAAKRIYDPQPGGNNNARLDPDEEAQVFVSLRNAGLGHGYNVRALLRSGDRRVQVSDSIGVYGLIPRDSTRENSANQFVVHADAGILPETHVPCTLYVSADGGYNRIVRFEIVVSEIRACDPMPDNMPTPLYWAYDDVDSGYIEPPVFNWTELRGRGTRLTLSDDQTVQITLPVQFGPWKYYGQRYSTISICSNGWVAAGSATSTAYMNYPLPSTSLPAPAVCLCWDDLYPPVGGGVWWYHDTLNHCFVVEWDSVSYYSPQTSWDKYEVLIYDTTLAAPDGANKVVVQYLTANNYGSTSAGIQNQNQQYGIGCLCDGAYGRGASTIRPNSAIKYTTVIPATGITDRPSPFALRPSPFLAIAPNPFKGQVLIRWQVKTAGRVTLKLFDVSGREMSTLCNSELKPNGYSATWTARDDQGRRVPTGIYILKLVTPDNTLMRKVVLTR